MLQIFKELEPLMGIVDGNYCVEIYVVFKIREGVFYRTSSARRSGAF
jgi:hypothetical protein